MASSVTNNQRVAAILLKIENGTVSASEETELKSLLRQQVIQGEAEYDKVKDTYTFKSGNGTFTVTKDFYNVYTSKYAAPAGRSHWQVVTEELNKEKTKYNVEAMTADKCIQILRSGTSNRLAIDRALSYYAMHYSEINDIEAKDSQRVMHEDTLKDLVYRDNYMRLKMADIAQQATGLTFYSGTTADAGYASAIKNHYDQVIKDFGVTDETRGSSIIEQKEAAVAKEAAAALLGNASLNLSDQDDFKLPDMGDYYLGNVDTTYLDEISKVYEKKKNAQAAASYAGNCPEDSLGYYSDKDIYFLKAQVDISDDDIDFGLFGPDFLTLSLDKLSSASDNNDAIDVLTEDIKNKTSEFPGLAGNAAGNMFELKLIGISALQPPRWALETNVPKELVQYKGVNSNSRLQDYNSDTYVVSYKDLEQLIKKGNVSFAFVLINNKWHQAELVKEEKDTISFRWMTDAGVEGFYQKNTIADNGKTTVSYNTQKLTNYDDNIYTKEILKEIITSAGGKVYVRFEGCGITPGSSTFPVTMASLFTNVNSSAILQRMAQGSDDMSYTGLNRIHVQTYRRYLGEAYVKMDSSYGDVYVNIAKLILSKCKDRIKEAQEVDEQYNVSKDLQAVTFSDDYEGDHRSSFQPQEYNLDDKIYADAFFETIDSLDDRKDIQKKLFHSNWDEMLDWNVTIGDLTFFVPPVNIRMQTVTHSERMSLLRAKGSAAKTDQRMNRVLAMDIFFNEDRGINGYPYTTNLDDIDKTPITYYLNSLRALVSMFKFTPFLPITNTFINQTLGIDAVVVTSLEIAAVTNYPKLIHATLTAMEFDWRVYMPDIVQLEAATTLGTIALQQESIEKAREVAADPDNIDAEAVKEVAEDLIVNTKYRNWFEKTINWKTFRYYYQRPIIRGNLLKSLNLDFNSEEYVDFTCGSLTSLIPMDFKDPHIKFFMANEQYLQAILQQRYEMLQNPGTTPVSDISFSEDQLEGLKAIDELHQALSDLAQNTEFQSTVNDLNDYIRQNKHLSFGDFVDVVQNAVTPDRYYNQGCITNGMGIGVPGVEKINACLARIDQATASVRTKYNTFFSQNIEYASIISKDGKTVAFAIVIPVGPKRMMSETDFEGLRSNLKAFLSADPFREQGNWEGPWDSGIKGVSEDRIIIPLSIEVTKVPGLVDAYYPSSTAKFQLDGSTPGMQLLPLAGRLIKAYGDKTVQTDTVPDINSLMNLVYDEYKLVDQSSEGFLITNWRAHLTNNVSQIRTLASDGYAPQYLGGEDVIIDIEINTQNKQAATMLTAIPKQISRLTRKYHLVMPCIPLRIESEISKFLSVNEVTCENAYISTTNNHPGLYTVNMTFRSMDRTLRAREAANRRPVNNSGYNFYDNTEMSDYGKGQIIGAGIGMLAGLLGGIAKGVAAGTVTAAGIGMTLAGMVVGAGVLMTAASIVVGVDQLIAGFQKASKLSSFGSGTEQARKYRHYFEMQNALAEIDLYPDLELPMVLEMQAAGFYFVRYKFQDNRLYVDPDFYFIYPVKLTSHIYRELAIHGMEAGIGDTTLTDIEGACVKIQPSVGNGYTVVEKNEQYEQQRKAVQEVQTSVTKMIKQEKLNKENNVRQESKIELPFMSMLNLTMERETWGVCEQIQAMFLERKFLKEVKSYEHTQKLEGGNKEVNGTEGRYVFNKLEDSISAAEEFYGWLSNNTIESTIPTMSPTAEAFFAARSIQSGEAIILNIKTAVSVFLEIREVRTFLEALNVDINDQFKALTANIVCAAACSATGDKEYSASNGSDDWKPNKVFIGVQTGTSQNTPSRNEIHWSLKDEEINRSNFEVAVKCGIEFGPFRIKMYKFNELQKMIYKGEDPNIVKPEEETFEEGNVNYQRFLLDPGYRTDSVALIEQYKGKCITSTAYATYAYLRLMFYWLCRLVYLRVFPNISSDVFRKNAQHEISIQDTTKELLGDANAEVMVKGNGNRLVSLRKHIDFFSKNMYVIDAGKIWTAAVLTTSEGDVSILSAIEKRNYDALNAILDTCSSPTSNFQPFNNLGALTIRKMTLALVGLGVVDNLSAIGVTQTTPAVTSDRDTTCQLYVDAAEDPKQYIPHSFHDMIVSDARGRMLRAFPTFYMCLIDEGREIGFWKMHDNFYNTSSISSIEIVKSRKIPTDVCTIVMSNFFNSYATELEDYVKTPIATFDDAWNSIFSPAEYFRDQEVARRNKPQDIKLRLRPGARIHVRIGYGNNATMIPVLFNGVIAEVSSESTVTIVAQGDGVELLNPINIDKEAHNLPNHTDLPGYSFLKNAISPLELAQALFTTYPSTTAEQTRKRLQWNLLPRNAFGIVHFGDPDFTTFCKQGGEACQNLFEMKEKPVYGGNVNNLNSIAYAFEDDVTRITFDLFQKTPWDVLNICKSICPDARLAVMPWGFRSTVFMGLPHFYYCYDYYKDQNNVVKEKRKPFQQWHIYTSELDIIGNGIVATNRDVKTVAVGLFQVCEGANIKYQRRVGPLYADWDIYDDVQRTMIVDTSLLGKGIPIVGPVINTVSTLGISIFDSGGIDALADDTGPIASHKKIAWRSTASALRDSVMDMYAGDLVVFGDPSVKPQDRMYIADKYTGINGQTLVKEVVHRISVEEGFTTTISPDCIATVADNTELIKYETMNRIGGFGAAASCLTSDLADSMSWTPSVGNVAAWAAVGALGTKFIGVPVSNAAKQLLQKVGSTAAAKAVTKGVMSGVGTVLSRVAATGIGSTIATHGARILAMQAIPGLGQAAALTYLAAMAASTIMGAFLNVAIENELRNHKVITVYPLRKYGYVYTAGFEGARGTVYGSPTWGDRGSLGDVFDFMEDYPLFGWLADAFMSDNVKALAKKYQRDNAMTDSNGDPVIAEQERARLLSHIAGDHSAYFANTYHANQLSPRATKKTPVAMTNSYNRFKKLDTKNWRNILKDVALISQDIRLQPYIKERFFQIVHEIAGLPVDGKMVTPETVDIQGNFYHFKAIHTVDGNGNAVIDVPFLHPEALNILAEIVKRSKDYMPNANPTDSYENRDITKTDYLALKSALRVGDRTSMGCTGYTFVLQGTAEHSQKALNEAITSLQDEFKEYSEVQGIETDIFEVKQQSNGEISFLVQMPQVSTEDELVNSDNTEETTETEVVSNDNETANN